MQQGLLISKSCTEFCITLCWSPGLSFQLAWKYIKKGGKKLGRLINGIYFALVQMNANPDHCGVLLCWWVLADDRDLRSTCGGRGSGEGKSRRGGRHACRGKGQGLQVWGSSFHPRVLIGKVLCPFRYLLGISDVPRWLLLTFRTRLQHFPFLYLFFQGFSYWILYYVLPPLIEMGQRTRQPRYLRGNCSPWN